jgi:hypothetical protein
MRRGWPNAAQWVAPRLSPDPAGLLLDAAAPPTAAHSATGASGIWASHTKTICKIRLQGRSAQRHQGGGQRPGDSRVAERPASLIHAETACRRVDVIPAQTGNPV